MFLNLESSQVKRNGSHIKISGIPVVKALVDTGATVSCISAELAEKIGILPDGKELVCGVHGEKEVNTYTPTLFIPQINFMKEKIKVMEVNFRKEDECQAILGMDILCQGTFQLDFSGNFVFCV